MGLWSKGTADIELENGSQGQAIYDLESSDRWVVKEH